MIGDSFRSSPKRCFQTGELAFYLSTRPGEVHVRRKEKSYLYGRRLPVRRAPP